MSLQSYLDASNVVNSIRLQLRHPSGTNKAWIIVEGETDQRLFLRLINGQNVEIEISFGGLNGVIDSVLELLEETNRIIGIIDADFMHLENRRCDYNNIFVTDFHDLEMMLISCDSACHAVAAEYLKEEKEPSSFRDKVLKSISFIGGLRWINNCECLELNFKNLGLGKFYDGQAVSIDEDKCLDEILRRSPNKRRLVLKQDVESKISAIYDFLNLCNGHDFQKAFSLCVSAFSNKGVKDTEIGKAFRVAYRCDDFKSSQLYSQLLDWSNINSIPLFNYET